MVLINFIGTRYTIGRVLNCEVIAQLDVLSHDTQCLVVGSYVYNCTDLELEDKETCLLVIYLTLILLPCIQQPCGYNATGQLQEPKDLTRPGSIYHTVFVRGFATTSAATH